MDSDLEHKVNLFFMHPLIDPAIQPRSSKTLSILYLLRRDIQGCLSESKYLIPATMAILAGIDLLAKFHAGDDAQGKVTLRFKNFVSTYFQPLAPNDAATVYALRNALLHSFGLYSEGRNFMLAERHSSGRLVVSESYYTIIAAHTLYSRLEQAITQYQDALNTDETLQQHFDRMFHRYGFMHMGVGDA